MKKLNRIIALATVAGSLFFASCSSDDNATSDISLGQYEDGVFVLNEGNTAPSSASISFISDNGAVENDVFSNVNPDQESMGSFLQSIFFDDTRAFIISGQANKMTVVDRYTFKFIATVDTNFTNPRYGTVANGKAYVTNAGSDWSLGTDDFVTVIDLSNYATSKIAVGNFAERILEENGKVYVLNGYYEAGTAISVINPATNSIEKTIELGFSPNSFEEENGTIYVIGSGKLAKINTATNTLEGTAVPITEGSKNIAVEGGKIYYTVANAVYAMNLNATAAPASALFSYNSTSVYGVMYGFAVNDDTIYISDAGDFSSNTNVYLYSLNGQLLRTIATGVAPNGFYFN